MRIVLPTSRATTRALLRVPATKVVQICQLSTATPALPGWFKRMAFTNEYQLPRLPVPQLSNTIERYLETIKPLVSVNEWKEHAELAERFAREEGRLLQDFLLKRELAQANARSYPYNYMEADWDTMYMGLRCETPVNINPAYGLVDETDGNLQGFIPRTSAFVHSLVKWWEKVKDSELEQDPKQCMSSFARQLGTARIPKTGRDVLESNPRSSHIVVMKGYQFYQLDVLSPDGKQLLSAAEIGHRLQEIMNDKDKPEHDVDLSTLTAQNRDTWAQLREELIAHHPVNEHSIKTIDSALFVLVLDDRASSQTRDRSELSLHGNAAHRWFDKVQVVAYTDGHLAINFEHSFSDGTAWNRWLHEVWHDMRGTDSGFAPLKQRPAWENTTKPVKLSWKLSNNLVADVEKAQDNFVKHAANNKTEFLEYTNFGKNSCKEWKLSPDGVAQMSFQLAFHAAHGKTPPTYESCSTRNFHHGRTETIRSATPAAAEFVQAVAGNSSKETQRELFVKAVKRHVDLAKTAQQGQGVDRHLMVLASIARENGIKSEFLESPVRAQSSNFQISSSNVTMPFLHYFTFGAVVPDGYGVGYLVHNKAINVNITNFADSKVTDGKLFKQKLHESLDTIRDLADSAP
ncbi:TPA: hypothetical protein N0F65_007185 [Lagenidium giganteum]|uniref:Choline/carnitine acyltransferase domain-containing protein n=1 Tax=Lagenidium giganteum TaxID=4803 RepID=A0AAV2Z4S2_9STRA|nr:TPA: hypothetical protein N0F65_007185 [Lagenidium giganteum]